MSRKVLENWELTNLGEIIVTKNNKSKQLKSTEYRKTGIFPVVDQSINLICGYSDEKRKAISSDLPIIIFGDHTRHTKFISFPFIAGADGTQLLKPAKGIDDKFFYYLVSFASKKIGNYGYDRHFKHLKDFQCLYPTDECEQQKIAAILTAIDRAIAHTEALIEKYQQIKAGLMHDLFTRGIGADGKLRPTREEAPELYQESAIGWIPKKWDVLQLRDCLIDNPTNGIYKSQDQIGQGTLMIGQTAFTEERSINFSLCRRGVISEAEKQHYYVAENNILITRVFATVDGVGLPTLVPQIHEEAVFESNMMRLRVDETKISSLILFEWLRNHRLRRLIVSGANASNQVSINQKTFNVLPIPLPSHDEQMRIANTIIASDSKHFTEKANLRKLVQKKSGLMHDLLTGKVPVNVNPDEVDRI